MAQVDTRGLPDGAAASLQAIVGGTNHIDVVAGAGANTNIAVTGLTASDVIVAALFVKIESGAVKDVSKLTLSAQTAGNIKTATDTTGGKVVVFWEDSAEA